MKQLNQFETKLWNAITAVASGIMTSLICDLISNTSYVIKYDNNQYVLTQSDNGMNNTVSAIFITVIIFFVFWGSFTVIIHIGAKTIRQLKFNEIKRFSGKDFVDEINNTKEQIIKLKNIYFDEQNMILNDKYAKLLIRELAVLIVSLQAKVNQATKHHNSHSKDYFRRSDYPSIININARVSRYEYIALTEILSEMVNNAILHTDGDELMDNDCKQMMDILNEIKEVVNALEK